MITSRARLAGRPPSFQIEGLHISVGTILVIVLILVGALPTWPHRRTWGVGVDAALPTPEQPVQSLLVNIAREELMNKSNGNRRVVAILSLNDLDIYPAMMDMAAALAGSGAEVHFFGSRKPKSGTPADVVFHAVQAPDGLAAHIPGARAGYLSTVKHVAGLRPSAIIAHHQYTLLAIAHKVFRDPKCKVVAYYSDYHDGALFNRLLKPLAGAIDGYIDVCHVRLGWRKKDWPGLRAENFLIRQAPFRSMSTHEPHTGPARIVLTGSSLLLQMNNDRLGRFLTSLGELGISVDWYLPGSDETRSVAQGLSSSAMFRVLRPISKAELIGILRQYDVGLFWAPMADADPTNPLHRSVFQSAASNKIGEYLAAGLVVAHTGNPGLSYLPSDTTIVFDPTDPDAGANQLAAELSDRSSIEKKRRAALDYHINEMNFEMQSQQLVRHLVAP